MRFALSLLLLVPLAGCVTLPTAPSVTMAPAPGKPFDVFRSEFEQCTKSAERQLGEYYDYNSTQEAQIHYDNVYLQCMRSHGNTIISPVIRWYRISPPPPAPGYNEAPSPNYLS